MKHTSLDACMKCLSSTRQNCAMALTGLTTGTKCLQQAQKCLTQIESLQHASVRSCQLARIPGYLSSLQGCLASRVDDCCVVWNDQREQLLSAAEAAAQRCAGEAAAYEAGPRRLPAEDDPRLPAPHCALQLVMDAADSFNQLLYLLLLQRSEAEHTPAPAREYVTSALADLAELHALMERLNDRLKVCRAPEDGPDGGGATR